MIEVTFNEKNLEIVKQRGIYILGHRFNLVRLSIDGPKLISFEPQNIVKSKAESQKVSLTFSEDASSLVGSIKFINKFHDINKNLKCISDSNDNKIINCEGLYDFTGEYQIVDEKGILLTQRIVNIVPKDMEKLDINNLINEKFLFDHPSINVGVKLPSKLFEEANEKTTLILETTDLFLAPIHKTLFFL